MILRRWYFRFFFFIIHFFWVSVSFASQKIVLLTSLDMDATYGFPCVKKKIHSKLRTDFSAYLTQEAEFRNEPMPPA